MIKQIYVSLEIAEKEVRVLVGEYFNTRFNILKLVKAPCDGVKNFVIVDSSSVQNAITSCMSEIKNKLGANVEKVILLVPPYNFRRYPLRVNVAPETGMLKKSDISRAITHTLDTKVDPDVMVVNRVPIKYTINGISYRRIPENEVCDEVLVDIDLLCADKNLVYSYAQVVENCGLEILDICLSNYAISKESVLIDQSINKNVVLLDINNKHTILSLFSKGKLYNSEIVWSGLENIVNALHSEYPLPYNTLLRLIKYNGSESNINDDMIFAYSKDEQSFSITKRQLNEAISIPIQKYINELGNICKPIVSSGETMFTLVGEGADLIVLCDKLKEETNSEIKVYCPDTLGVREPNLMALYGSFFAEKEMFQIKEQDVNCIDLLEFEKVVDHKKLDAEGETLTTKIKMLFEQYVNKEK